VLPQQLLDICEELEGHIADVLVVLDDVVEDEVSLCNTTGVMVTKIGHVIICIAKHSCLSQL
jgi:hypothetical protein